MKVVKRNLSELHISELNVRRHPRLQIEELKKSYNMFGQYRPLVVSSDGEILVGNGLYLALVEIGLETAECYVLPSDTSDLTKKKLMLADNKIYDLGTENRANIDLLLSTIDDFDIPGFDEEVLRQLDYNIDMSNEIISNMYKMSPEAKEAVARLEAERREHPPAAPEPIVPSKAPPVVVQNSEDLDKIYVTCPHCGMRIWLS